ncbi:MAG: DUF1292 domain-containing protein [Lachnospiraceae bacterium]|nr:DUF1292 domain-containing protein [Lachnospiraceae bacterium]
MEKITFNPDGEEPVDFFVLEQTRIGGYNYILVTDEEDGDGEALILKDFSADGEQDSLYSIVSDDTELKAVAEVFEKMLEDVELVDDEESFTASAGNVEVD